MAEPRDDIKTIVEQIELYKSAGLTTFQAMAAGLEDEDWEICFIALRDAAKAGAA